MQVRQRVLVAAHSAHRTTVLQRVVVLAAATWHFQQTRQPTNRFSRFCWSIAEQASAHLTLKGEAMRDLQCKSIISAVTSGSAGDDALNPVGIGPLAF